MNNMNFNNNMNNNNMNFNNNMNNNMMNNMQNNFKNQGMKNNNNNPMNFNNQMNNNMNMMINNQNMPNNINNNFNNGNQNMMNQNNFNNGNGNQNMMNQNNFNNGNGNQNNFSNFNHMGNNSNMNIHFERKRHIPNNNNESVLCLVKQESNSIDRNEINEIKNIVQLRYSASFNNPNDQFYLSDLICNDIKKKLQGEWFVFVSEIGQNIPFCISTVSESEYLILTVGKTFFKVAKIK